MRSIKIKTLLLSVSTLWVMGLNPLCAQAEQRTFILEYAGTTASASGTIAIDDAYLVNPGSVTYVLPSDAFISLSLTLIDDPAAGTYTLSDFSSIVLATNGATLDLSTELVGQLTNGDPWGTPSGNGGDFNLFGSTLNGSYYFTLSTGTDFLELISFRPEVLLTLLEVQGSLLSTNVGMTSVLANINLLINGAHSRPMSRRVKAGENTVWLAGDWGNDNHGSRDGTLGLAEVGVGRNFGLAQINFSLGKTWSDQDLIYNGDIDTDGQYLMVEGIIPVLESQGVYVTLGAYRHWADVDIKRGFSNGGTLEYSKSSADARSWGLRARVDWEDALVVKTLRFSPYLDLWHTKTKLDSYTEVGGSFPAHFDSRKDRITELHAGVNFALPISTSGFDVIANLEAVHRFDDESDKTSGEVFGLFNFNLDGESYDQDWLKGGIGVEGSLAMGKMSLMVNGSTDGEMPSSWIAASYQMSF
jgi:hypothetical protein